jgi:hypothetical protein
VGAYPITITASNIASPAATQAFTLTVTPASLQVTASSASATYGGTVPAITPSYAGFVNGDTPASLTTAPTCTTTATSQSAVGSYPSSCSGAVDPNYTIGYTPGTVTVVKTVDQQLSDLLARVQGVGPGKSLTAKVRTAQADLRAGDTVGACRTMNDFISEVQAQSGKSINVTVAQQLVAAARQIEAAIPCR